MGISSFSIFPVHIFPVCCTARSWASMPGLPVAGGCCLSSSPCLWVKVCATRMAAAAALVFMLLGTCWGRNCRCERSVWWMMRWELFCLNFIFPSVITLTGWFYCWILFIFYFFIFLLCLFIWLFDYYFLSVHSWIAVRLGVEGQRLCFGFYFENKGFA